METNKVVEGHYKWIEEILSEIPLVDFQAKQDYVAGLLKKISEFNEEWKISGWSHSNNAASKTTDNESECNLDDYNDQHPIYASLLAVQLNKSSMLAYTGDVEEAEKIRKGLWQVIQKLTGVHARLFPAMEYALESWQLSLNLLKSSNEPGTSMKSKSLIKEIDAVKSKWEFLQSSGISRAVLWYLKESLRRELLVYNEERKLQLFKQLIEMDPDYHVWYHFAYQKARSVRVDKNKKCPDKRQGMYCPPEEEAAFCEMAYQLAPNIALSLLDMIILLKDKLFSIPIGSCKNKSQQEIRARCLEHLDMAINLVETTNLDETDKPCKWILRIYIQKADYLLRYGENREDPAEGLNLLLDCLETYPTNYLLHKNLGNVYLHGISVAQNGNPSTLQPGTKDIRKAMHHFRVALECQNYKFLDNLRNYMWAFRNCTPPLPIEEALAVLNKCLDASTLSWQKENQESQIRIWRAAILWIYGSENVAVDDKRAACEDWLYVLENYPDAKGDLFRSMERPKFFVYGSGTARRGFICTNKVINVLQMLKQEKSEDAMALQTINMFVEQLKNHPRTCHGRLCDVCANNTEKADNIEWPGSSSHIGVRSSNTNIESNAHWRTTERTRFTSEADEDDNWRAKK